MKTSKKLKYSILLSGLLFSSYCDFLDVENSKAKVTADKVFSNDITATAAVLGIYYDMLNSLSFSSGTNNSVVTLAGLSSDELTDYPGTNFGAVEFEVNSINPANPHINLLWSSMYKSIYESNAVLEGLNSS